MRSLWTLRRSLDVWSVAIKTWQVEPETNMQVKLISPLSPAKRKKKKKPNPTNKNTLISASYLIRYLKRKYYKKFFSIIAMSPQFSALLIFYTFHGSKSLNFHLQGLVAKVEFYGGHRTELSIFLWKTHLWGKTWPSQWPISALMK